MKTHASHLLPAILIGGALLGACGDDGKTSSGAGASGATSSSSGGNTGGAGGSGGMASALEVGVGVRVITPVLAETEWNDLNNDGYYDPSKETFSDTNGNGKFDATWLAGFGTGRPATGINDNVEVRAIAFRQNGQTVVVAILDAIGYFIDDMDKVRADPTVTALGVDHILIGATHLHESVDTIGLWGPTDGEPGLDPEYQKMTRDRTAAAIVEAVGSLQPARMRVAQTKTLNPDGVSTLQYVNDVRDPIIYDPTLTIARFTEEGDPTKTIATLVNWSAHPEYAGSGNHLITADYVHWLRHVTEGGLPGEGIAGLGGKTVFVQGALGGQVGPGGVQPLDFDGLPVPKGLPKAQAAGTNVAKLALDALEKDGQDESSNGIVYREKEIFSQVDNLSYHFAMQLGLFDREFYKYDPQQPIGPGNIPHARSQVAYLQVGPIAMITAPGELHPELWVGGYDGSWSFGQPILSVQENAPDLSMAPKGPYLRDLMLDNPGVKYSFVGGLVGDFLGYIVPSFNFVLDPNNPYVAEAPGDHYEETNSISPKCEEHLQHPMMDLAKTP
jgi:hypothetical protein